MTTNQKQYMEEINNNEEYNITVEEFTQWLKENNEEKEFTKMLNNKDLDDYDIALDYTIPVTMVKYFRTK